MNCDILLHFIFTTVEMTQALETHLNKYTPHTQGRFILIISVELWST